ncbi:MAG TPA: hypothetical protein PKH36_10625, partial [Flavobacteriales bacterium]|nr:hypothetical protein [Flavobacteriales bacterium]
TALGHAAPTETVVDAKIGYSTRIYQRAADRPWKALYAMGRAPAQPRSGVIYPIEGGRWIVTLAGYGPENHPPTDDAGFTAFARALAQDTPLILLDEPTAFLDLPNRAAIVRMLRQVAHEEGKCVLFSTHDLQLAIDLSDRLLLISDGALWTGTHAEALNTGTLERTFAGSGIRFDSGGTHRFER